jgi:hypothetical protein
MAGTVAHSMEQSPSWEADTRLPDREFPEANYRYHRTIYWTR